jgi:predicted transcriptional regulator
MSSWTLFSNHGHVLVCLARDSEARLRDVAADVGITERAVQKIVRDLQDGDMISIKKNGRRNSYRIHKKQTLRHELEASCKLRDLLKVVNKDVKQRIATDEPAEKPDPVVSARPESTKRPDDEKPARAARVRKAETAESKPAGGNEKQQGSLF